MILKLYYTHTYISNRHALVMFLFVCWCAFFRYVKSMLNNEKSQINYLYFIPTLNIYNNGNHKKFNSLSPFHTLDTQPYI